MKSFKELINEQTNINDLIRIGQKLQKSYNIIDFDTLKSWLKELNVPNRKPSKLSKTHFTLIKKIIESVKEIESAGRFDNTDFFHTMIAQQLKYFRDSEIEELVNALSNSKAKVTEMEVNGVEYLNTSASSEKVFKDNVKNVSKLLSKFKGFHKKALDGKLKVVFKSSKELKSKAMYKSDRGEIWIKMTSAKSTGKYGSLEYIIVHELGHRYQHLHNLPKNWKITYTTKYSKTSESWDENAEPFAELFALSFYKKDYPEYKTEIQWFENLIG